jgi:hypothetical protein
VAVFVKPSVGDLADDGEQLGDGLEQDGEPAVSRAADAGRLWPGQQWRRSARG